MVEMVSKSQLKTVREYNLYNDTYYDGWKGDEQLLFIAFSSVIIAKVGLVYGSIPDFSPQSTLAMLEHETDALQQGHSV